MLRPPLPRACAVLSVTFLSCLLNAPQASAFTQAPGEFCFSCEGNFPMHPVPPDLTPPDIFLDDLGGAFNEPPPAEQSTQIAGVNIVAPGFFAATSSQLPAVSSPQLVVTHSATADLAALSDPNDGFAGAGTTAPIWFSNEPGILVFDSFFVPFFPPFPPEPQFVSGYSFLSVDGGPNFRSVLIPDIHIFPNGPAEGIPVNVPAGDGEFQIWVDGVPFDFSLNERFDFTAVNPAGVNSFFITGFDASEEIQTNDGLPFTYGAEFVSQGVVRSAVLPLIPSGVPEPSAALLLALACLQLSSVRGGRSSG